MALKGRRLAFVEVKRRKTVRAAQYWLAGHPDFSNHDIAFDVVLTTPWSLPRYIANAFPV